jgi:hypothetical protein
MTSSFDLITPAAKYSNAVIPAQAGHAVKLYAIQKSTGCRIKPGMTELAI